jgi:hypothetical protein
MFKRLIGIVAGVSLMGAPVLVGCQDRGGAGSAGQEQPFGDDGVGGAGDIDRDRTWEQDQNIEQREFEPGPDEGLNEGLNEGTGGAGELDRDLGMENEQQDSGAGQDEGMNQGTKDGMNDGTGGAGHERDMEAEDRKDRDFGIDTNIDATDVPGGGGTGTDEREQYRE